MNLTEILMRKTYLRPDTKTALLAYDIQFLQSGGSGQGSDMDDPDDTQNPF